MLASWLGSSVTAAGATARGSAPATKAGSALGAAGWAAGFADELEGGATFFAGADFFAGAGFFAGEGCFFEVAMGRENTEEGAGNGRGDRSELRRREGAEVGGVGEAEGLGEVGVDFS